MPEPALREAIAEILGRVSPPAPAAPERRPRHHAYPRDRKPRSLPQPWRDMKACQLRKLVERCGSWDRAAIELGCESSGLRKHAVRLGVRRRRHRIALAFALALVATASDAAALVPGTCGDATMIRETLRIDRDQAPASFGLPVGPAQSAFAELYLSSYGGWTLVERRIDGTACVILSGSNWQAGAVPIAAGGSK